MEVILLYGLVQEGKILSKKEKEFYEEERLFIKDVIIESVNNFIRELLTENEIDVKKIQSIGISAPGTSANGIIIKAENLGIVDFNFVRHFKGKVEI